MRNRMCLALALTVLLTPYCANADVKIVQSTTVINARFAAQREVMTDQQKAAIHRAGDDILLGIPVVSTSYSTPKFLRIDFGTQTMIVDTRAGTSTAINRTSKVYEITPLDSTADQSGGYQVTITPTGKHAKLLGQPVTVYNISATNISLPGTLVTGQVWSATNLPHPDFPAGSGPLTAVGAILRQVHGTPLRLTLKITGTSAGATTIQSKALSISTANLPASLFAVPKGYKQGDPTAGSAAGSGLAGQF